LSMLVVTIYWLLQNRSALPTDYCCCAPCIKRAARWCQNLPHSSVKVEKWNFWLRKIFVRLEVFSCATSATLCCSIATLLLPVWHAVCIYARTQKQRQLSCNLRR
jgi:hypothetical protein